MPKHKGIKITSNRVARAASKILRDKKTSKITKSVAGSVLSQSKSISGRPYKGKAMEVGIRNSTDRPGVKPPE